MRQPGPDPRDDGGQALVEFALVLPLVIVLVFAIVQFGIALSNYIALTDAVRVGARAAAVSRTAANPVARAENAVRASAVNLDQTSLNVTVTSTWRRGEEVGVAATYPYEIDLIGLVVAAGNLRSETKERVE